jgi:hypothetical protein
MGIKHRKGYSHMANQRTSYRIKNWPQYNQALKNRGSITFWFAEEQQNTWKSSKKSEKKGRPEVYSDSAIECLLVLKQVYNFPLRALEGFMKSIINLSQLDLVCPDYTTISRRTGSLDIQLPKNLKSGARLNILVDSSGLKIFGEGEWKTRQHGISKRRTWRKLHIAISLDTQEIVGTVFTTRNVSDCQVFDHLLHSIDSPIDSVYGDGAYDTVNCYNICDSYGAVPIIPPNIRAKKQKRANYNHALRHRDLAVEVIECYGGDIEGRKQWKKDFGYHKRSLVETGFFRIKTLFGSKLKCRKFINQANEAVARCVALNKMTGLGMPQSYQFIS